MYVLAARFFQSHLSHSIVVIAVAHVANVAHAIVIVNKPIIIPIIVILRKNHAVISLGRAILPPAKVDTAMLYRHSILVHDAICAGFTLVFVTLVIPIVEVYGGAQSQYVGWDAFEDGDGDGYITLLQQLLLLLLLRRSRSRRRSRTWWERYGG